MVSVSLLFLVLRVFCKLSFCWVVKEAKSEQTIAILFAVFFHFAQV